MEYSVLNKIVESKKMPILFIGSGISSRYLYRFPTWDGLLEKSFYKVYADPYQYQKHKDALSRQGLSEFEIKANLGSIIEGEFNQAFFDRKIKVGTTKNPSWVRHGISPYKMYLSQYFKHLNINNHPDLQREIALLKNLKNKIGAIITTNYDSFLEKEIFPEDYTVFIHQNELFSSDSYNIAEIYKIHGCVNDANSIIITEKDYEGFFDSRKLIIAKMLTLFSEAPIIFLGYSFTDENIQIIISEFLSCLTSKELSNISEHFVFISRKKNEEQLIEIKRTITTKNNTEIPITEIQTDNFTKIYEILTQITPSMQPSRIRDTRRLVKRIVDHSIEANEPDAFIVGLDDMENIDLVNKPLAIAVGYRESILNTLGYGILPDEAIHEDILFDNKSLNPESMCTERFKSIATTRLIPVFKYVKAFGKEIPETSKLYTYITNRNSIDKIISKKVLKTLNSVPILNNYSELIVGIDQIEDLNKKSGLLLKNINGLSAEQIRGICIDLFNKHRSDIKYSTNFKRCVMVLDLIENQ